MDFNKVLYKIDDKIIRIFYIFIIPYYSIYFKVKQRDSMPEYKLRLIKRCEKYLPVDKINFLPKGLRGVYVLYKYSEKTYSYNVVYVGVSCSRSDESHIRRKLKVHRRKKECLWSHFSIFEVWENIRDDEIRELKGLFREIYMKDSSANKIHKQEGTKRLKSISNILK
jgi:hypothetical protein